MSFNSNVTPKIKIILGTLFAFTGIGRLWLWHEGLGNNLALYLGIALIVGAAIIFWGIFKGGANA